MLGFVLVTWASTDWSQAHSCEKKNLSMMHRLQNNKAEPRIRKDVSYHRFFQVTLVSSFIPYLTTLNRNWAVKYHYFTPYLTTQALYLFSIWLCFIWNKTMQYKYAVFFIQNSCWYFICNSYEGSYITYKNSWFVTDLNLQALFDHLLALIVDWSKPHACR